MKEQEKRLLIKDLCARLPYEVKVFIQDISGRYSDITEKTLDTYVLRFLGNNNILIKPYLRPMSSMTEEEYKQYRKFSYYGAAGYRNNDYKEMVAAPSFEKMDFLNTHHFDYRGLIEKGLALVATANMYHIPETIKKDEPIDFSKLNDDMYNEDGWMTIRDGFKMDREGHIVGGLKLK